MNPFSLAVPPLFAALAPAQRVLIAGAGGGFDVYAGLPLALALRAAGVEVHLASLSFSELELVGRESWVADHVVAVTPESTSPDWYFPEGVLSRWLAARCLYLDRIENTVGRRQVITRIEAFRSAVTTRIPRVFPH